jgi:hypothetical protein
LFDVSINSFLTEVRRKREGLHEIVRGAWVVCTVNPGKDGYDFEERRININVVYVSNTQNGRDSI